MPKTLIKPSYILHIAFCSDTELNSTAQILSIELATRPSTYTRAVRNICKKKLG